MPTDLSKVFKDFQESDVVLGKEFWDEQNEKRNNLEKEKEKTAEELEASIVCPVCKGNDIQDNSQYKDNGGYVGHYEQWKVTDTRACLTCGVMFIPVEGNGIKPEEL